MDDLVRQAAIAKAQQTFGGQFSEQDGISVRQLFTAIAGFQQHEQSGWESDKSIGNFLRSQKSQIERENVRANYLRNHAYRDSNWTTRTSKYPDLRYMVEKANAGFAAKSVLDVGTQTSFNSIVGGQSVGYMSLDTRLYRATIRPNSFTLYNYLPKTQAFQVVDLWSTAQGDGGGPAGTAYNTFGNVQSGTLATSAGEYFLNTLFLKLAVNGRAVTIPLAAQNSFVDIAAQETANAALTVLRTINWANYWGNATLYPSQQNGIFQTVSAATSGANIYNFMQYVGTQNANYSNQQYLFNLIYEIAGTMTKQYTFSHITHAMFGPDTAGDIQSLTTTLLNNLITLPSRSRVEGIVVNGDFNGMKTRFGEIQFPIDICIGMRTVPVQAYVNSTGGTQATTSAPTPPSGFTAVPVTGVSGSLWYVSGGVFAPQTTSTYQYAIASTDAYMNESNLVWATATGVASAAASSGAYKIVVSGANTNDFVNYRIFRSGLNCPVTGVPQVVRWIADVAANGSGTVTFNDLNAWIPGSEGVFLLDLDEADAAIDYRVMLPLVKINLFAQNLYMPWCVAGIGAIRLTIPKFHAVITNYIATNPSFNPLMTNFPVQGNFGGL